MDLVDLIVERAISEAIARGEFDTSALHGAQLADLDERRPPGWWAEQYVVRERSRALREDAEPELAIARAQLWRSASIAELRDAVATINKRIVVLNARLEPADRLPLVEYAAALEAWRRSGSA